MYSNVATPSQELIKPEQKLLAEKIPLKILVAEDNYYNQKIMEAILETLGYHPIIVENGLEVLEYLGENDCDVIFLDLRQSSRQSPYVIAITANVMIDEKEKCLELGIDGYLTKSVTLQQISDILIVVTGQ